MAAAAPPSQPPPAEGSRDPTDYIVPEDDGAVNDGPDFLDAVSEKGSSTNSLTSSVLNFQYENGRRYHAYREGEYVAPNDDQEQDRMDLHHHIYRLMVGGALTRAPIGQNPGRILDLGTGTGIWAIEMADEFPDSVVIGTDLSPIQPRWVPPNCYFEVDDYESEWDFSRPFDFIHGRGLEGTIKDHGVFLKRVLQSLKPGGWLENVVIGFEMFSDDDTIKDAPYCVEWGKVLNEASVKFGKPTNTAHQQKDWMENAGFKNVRQDVYKVPVSPWAKDRKMKELGAYNQANLLDGLETYTLALCTRVFGWSIDELHLYVKTHFIYGQKEA